MISSSIVWLKLVNHLALIDFGTAREVTQSYHHKAAGQKVTGIISPGYTPPEQLNGKAVLQSDFFALGRTFVYLLTGKSPDVFPEDPRTGKLSWRDSASQVSKQVAGLIDYLMEPFPGKRPQNAQMILRCISEINQTRQSSKPSASQLVPPTLVQSPRHSKQTQFSATTQIHSSKTQTNTSSRKFASLKYTWISGIILILIKFGSWQITKLFSPQPSHPVVASTSKQIETDNSQGKDNSSEQLKTDLDRQVPPTPIESTPPITENTPPVIPPGWKKFQGGGAELWLPESYQIIDKTNLNKIVKNLKTLGHQGNFAAQSMQVGYSASTLFSIDPTTGNCAIVAKEQVPTNITLQTYMEQTENKLPNYMRVLDMKINSIEEYETGQVITEINDTDRQITYLIKDRSTIWYISFLDKANEFELYLPIFDTSVHTFRFQRTLS